MNTRFAPLTFLKSLLGVLAVALTTALSPVAQAQVAEETERTPHIEFFGEVYHLAWASDPAPHYSKTEYLPEDEELPYYFNMLLVERVDGVSATEAVRAQVEFLQGINESEEGADGAKILNLMENPNTGEVLLVFVLSAPDEEREVIWEWNAYRYSPVQTVNGEESVRLFGYSRRHYGNDESVYDFLEEIDVDNPNSEAVNAVLSAQLP